ncbi:nucleoside 2-deoxyribosyltransferase [Pseudomonas aeruginosa]
MPNSRAPRVYLAGFDVFLPDPIERGNYLKGLCEEHGLEGLYPMDNAFPAGMNKHDTAAWIAKANIEMIKSADCVLANLGDFRGQEPDSGTCFEFGMAIALGKPVWAYTPDLRPLIEQVNSGASVCQKGFSVEDFDLPRNLMMACTWAGVSLTAEEAIPAFALFMKQYLEVKRAREGVDWSDAQARSKRIHEPEWG